jgi:hypothetical protein
VSYNLINVRLEEPSDVYSHKQSSVTGEGEGEAELSLSRFYPDYRNHHKAGIAVLAE